MKILLIANHYAVASGRYMTDAFKRLGHDVRHIGPAHGRSIWGMDVDAKYVWEPDVLPLDTDWLPDLTIVADSDPAVTFGAQEFEGHRSGTLVVWGVDNHVRDYRRPWFDHYFLAHRGVSVMEWGENYSPSFDYIVLDVALWREYPDMTWLPCAYDPTLFTPSPIPYAEREYDVCMIGVMYPQRWQLVQELRDAGLKVLAGTGLIYDQYVAAYHNARISLCVSAAGDVAQRVFETAAMGCLVVSDPCADFARLKPEGIRIANSGEQLVWMCRHLIAHTELAQEMIAQSLEWVRGHEWDARAQVIIDWLQKRQAGDAFYATAE